MSRKIGSSEKFYDFVDFSTIDCRFLLRRALEVIVGINFLLALIQQWIIPSVVNSLIPFSVSKLSVDTV